MGQFINYRTALRSEEPERTLYLAVPLATYNDFFTLPFTQTVARENQLKLLIYKIDTQEIAGWIS